MTYKELIKKYGNIKVKFVSYYKNSFCFIPIRKHKIIKAIYRHFDTYRFEVERDLCYTIIDIEPDEIVAQDGEYYAQEEN